MFLSLILAAATSGGLGLHVHPCTEGKAKLAAVCGTYGVYEDRAAKSGRIIQINLVVIKAKHPTHHAMALIAGGPGQASVGDEVEPIADNAFELDAGQLRDTYDLLFMDDRGMGDSHLLQCDFTSDPRAYFAEIVPDKMLRACRARLAATSNLALYNTNNATDDLNDIRVALGYPKLVLNGGSYGTYFALIYLRRHPESVESEVLDGVSPPHFQPLPGEPLGVQHAFDDLVAKCARDAACTKHFPNFASHFKELLARLDRGPIPVTLRRKGKSDMTVQMSKEVFVDRLREVLYDPDAASYVPYMIERAHDGDTWPLGKIINLVTVSLDQDLAMGAWLSYTCQDWIPFLDEAAVQHAAAHSFAGDLRIEAQRRACAVWNVPAQPLAYDDPVRSDAPILMISGSDDPATPPQYADRAAAYLPNARIVLVQGAGHASESPCTDRLVVQFVRARSAAGLNVRACSEAFKTPPFATSLAGVP